jgi:hypothetical protein
MTPSQNESVRKLEWAIGLAQVDLQTFREGDWLNIGGELKQFIEGSGGITDVDEATIFLYGMDTVQDLVGKVQKDLREHFEQLAHPTEPRVVGSKIVSLKSLSAISFLVNGRVQVEAFAGQPYRLVTKQTRVADQASFALASYLVSAGINAGQIRKCPTCDRIFLLKRKPRTDVEFHCSLRCARLAATRRYRKNKGEELLAKERERKHQEYKKKKRMKFPNVPVQRRPRKKR